MTTTDLRAAAQAVVARWDTPLWKDAPHTAEFIERLRTALAEHEAAPTAPDAHPSAAPIDMVLHCPACGMQHIDAPEPGRLVSGGPNAGRAFAGWINPPHRSHLCHGCGHIWRPADVPTNGVAAVKTKGKNDSHAALRGEPEAAGHGSVEGDVRALRQMVADCEVYLKEGETPAQRIERERRDTEAVLNLLIREKQRTEAMREVMLRMMAGIDHLAEISRQWEPDHSSGADRRGWVLAKDARDDAARLLQPEPQAASVERGL